VVDGFDVGDKVRVSCQVVHYLCLDVLDDGWNGGVLDHHFLVMALGLLLVASGDQQGHIAVDFECPASLGGAEVVAEVGEVGDVEIVFVKVPAILLQLLGFPPELLGFQLAHPALSFGPLRLRVALFVLLGCTIHRHMA